MLHTNMWLNYVRVFFTRFCIKYSNVIQFDVSRSRWRQLWSLVSPTKSYLHNSLAGARYFISHEVKWTFTSFLVRWYIRCAGLLDQSWSWVTFSKPNPTQPKISGPNPTQPNQQKSSPDPTQPIIDTWYGILGYTENFIQQLLHVTDKFYKPTVNESYYSAAVLINRQ